MLKKRLSIFFLLSFLIASLPAMALGGGVSADTVGINANQVTIAGQAEPAEWVSISVAREDGKRAYIHQLCADASGDYQFLFSLDKGEYNTAISANGEKLEIADLHIHTELDDTAGESPDSESSLRADSSISANQVVISGQAEPAEWVSLCVVREDGKRAYIHQVSADEFGNFSFAFSLDRGEYTAGISANEENLEIRGLTINSQQEENNNNGGDQNPQQYSASISIQGDEDKGTILSTSTWKWTGTTTVIDVLTAILDKNDIDYRITYGGSYVESIDGLAHKKTAYPNSGWLYEINGETAGAANTQKVRDGDIIEWFYTLDYKEYADFEDSNSSLPEMEKKAENILRAEDIQTATRITFPDVGDDIAWAKDAIEILAGQGIIKGSDSGFEPYRCINRAELVALLVRIKGLDNSGGSGDFSDVQEGDWFYNSVSTALAHGWIRGYPDATFRPNAYVSRNELACLLDRIAGAAEEPSAAGISFTDLDLVPAWALNSVKYTTSKGFISAYPDGSFQGECNLSRAEAAVAVYNFLQSQ